MLKNEHVDLYDGLDPQSHHLQNFPPPEDRGDPLEDVDEKMAEIICYGQLMSVKDMKDPKLPFLFAIRLGRKLERLKLQGE